MSRRTAGQQEATTWRREVPRDRRMESAVAALLIAAAVLGVAFAVLYVLDASTQLLGLSLGMAFACLAAALIVAGKRVVPQETAILEKPPLPDVQERFEARDVLAEGGEGISRRGLLLGAAGAAGAGVGVALALPIASLGPDAGARLARTPWRRGRYLVDERGQRLTPDDLAVGGFTTAFPEGADKEAIGSPVIVVRMRPEEIDLPAERRGWAQDGVVAYSKICTHAGCAVATFRYPLYEPQSPPPALVCPCHYSTFDPRTGGERTFGPAARPLPQLPLALDAQRRLVAAGPLSGPPGPSYPTVRTQR
jgi:ubiquinol-cytochrome c reductase iron-sulfur subunit